MNKTMMAFMSQYKYHVGAFFIGVLVGIILYKLLESRMEGFTISMGNHEGKIVMSDDDILLMINNVFTLEEEFTKADIKHVVHPLKKAYMKIVLDGVKPKELLLDETFKKQLIDRMLASDVNGEFKFDIVPVKENAYLKRQLNTKFTKDKLEKEIEFMAKYYIVRKLLWTKKTTPIPHFEENNEDETEMGKRQSLGKHEKLGRQSFEPQSFD
jgi:hypothetical protein